MRTRCSRTFSASDWRVDAEAVAIVSASFAARDLESRVAVCVDANVRFHRGASPSSGSSKAFISRRGPCLRVLRESFCSGFSRGSMVDRPFWLLLGRGR